MKNQNRIKKQLSYQITFLKNSCDLYDRGFFEEAIRIAVALENLLSLRKNATSLIKHLNAENTKVFSTTESFQDTKDYQESRILFLKNVSITDGQNGVRDNHPSGQKKRDEINKTIVYFGLGVIALGTCTEESSYFADLMPINEDNGNNLVSIEEWMEEVVLIANRSFYITRKDLIAIARNKDGGGHVVKNLKGPYKELSNDGALGFFHKNRLYAPNANLDEIQGEPVPIKNAHFVALRQMAHEILSSPDIIDLYSQTEGSR